MAATHVRTKLKMFESTDFTFTLIIALYNAQEYIIITTMGVFK